MMKINESKIEQDIRNISFCNINILCFLFGFFIKQKDKQRSN